MSGDDDDIATKTLELYDWISEIEFSRPKKCIARDFADVLMAELLKKYYPRVVDLHNYPPANSFRNKLKNWETLNVKVLTPLGFHQSEKFLKDVASGIKGTIELLLYTVKTKLDESKIKEEQELEQGIHNAYIEEVSCSEDEQFQSTVSLAEFKKMKETINTKNEEITYLNSKIKHLEAMIQLKDQRIDDLVAQINRCTCLRNVSSYSME